MAWGTHNIVAPSQWTIYDLVDRPLPKQVAVYPNPDAMLPQPRSFYVMGYPNWELGAGTLTTTKLYLKDLRDPVNVLEVINYLLDSGFVYDGPYNFLVGLDDSYEAETAGKLMSDNIVAQGPITDCALTRGTQGYTFTINN